MSNPRRGKVALVYRHIASPVGSLLAVASRRGLAALSFEPDATLEQLGLATPRTAAPSEAKQAQVDHPGVEILDQVETQLSEYFAGQRYSFALVLDLLPTFEVDEGGPEVPNPWVSASGRFRQTVQVALSGIPYGQTASYGQVAERVGHPRAARAVGSACATNPLPIILPCHRVTKADGSLGNYTGGTEIKRALLDLERPCT